MGFRTEPLGNHITLKKGLSYKGESLVDVSDVGLLTMDAFITGGGYKRHSEKPYAGDFKPEFCVEPGDVLLAMTEQQEGLLASPLLIQEDLGGYRELVYSLDVAKIVLKSGMILPEFVYNFFRVPINRKRAAFGDTGTTVQRLPYEVVYEQMVQVPSIEEQELINTFIATIDRKIQLNASMAETLENIAQSIFRSWFVDFDPVKAKIAGEKPVGMDDATTALFPDSMEDSELGLMPKGWSVRALGQVLDCKKVTVKASKETESCPYIPIDQIDPQSIFLRQSAPGSEARTSLLSFLKNDILFGAMRPYFHKVVLAPFDGTTRTTTLVLRSKVEANLSFALFTVFQKDFVSYATNHSQGSTIPYAVWAGSLENYPAVTPSAEVATVFNGLVLPLINFGYGLIAENTTLVELRDSLLPRLISGELQIPEEMLAS